MKDFFLIDHQIQPIRHCIPDIDPGKSDCKDERNPEYPDQDPSKRFFFHHGSSSFIHSLSATPLSRLHCSFPKLPLPFYRFHFIRQSFPSVTETVIKKGEAAFLLLSYYVMLFYFHPVSFFSFCRFIPLFEVQLCDSSSPLPDVSSPRHFPVLFP